MAIMEALDINKNTITDWNNFVQEIIDDFMKDHNEVIGERKIVEVDEAV